MDIVNDSVGQISITIENQRLTISQPRNKFPQLVYEWTNWVYCCKRCNDEKAGKWPNSGFVDPCADTVSERPERYLDIDVVTGEIIANAALDRNSKIKAQNTIEYIGLNASDLRESRYSRFRYSKLT